MNLRYRDERQLMKAAALSDQGPDKKGVSQVSISLSNGGAARIEYVITE